MKKFLIGILAVIGALAILAVFVVLGVGVVAQLGQGSVPGRTILEIDLERGIVEFAPGDPLERLFREDEMSVRDVVDALDKAAGDRRVVGAIAKISAAPMSMATIQEVRDAISSFRASGKPAVAYAETFGEFGPGNGAYYLATAFDEIYLQPSGDIGLTGMIAETPFIKGTLDKLGIIPRMDQRYEYKNAMNFYTERGFTDAHRESMSRIIESRYDQMVRGIAERRAMTPEQVRELIDNGPYIGQEAVEAGLVDGLAYRDEVYGQVKEDAGSRARLLYLSKYLKRAGRPNTRGDTIALIYGVGAVVRGSGGYDPLSGDQYMGSDSVARAFRQAVDNKRVKAIIFRVDSPGGSYVASDSIWRETIRAKEAGKPVIVSMGNVAGSGGYFVAMSAEKIVAQPSTITGSIGVLGGKLLTEGMWNKIGMTWDEVHAGRNATQWSTLRDYTPQGHARFQAGLDRIYEDFTAKVAEGRGLDKQRLPEIAKGRIWTGEDALELGLVDALGGFPEALRLAREAAGLEPDARVRVRLFPRSTSALDQLFGEPPDSSDQRMAASLERVVKEVRPLVRMARELGLLERPGVLTMPGAEQFR